MQSAIVHKIDMQIPIVVALNLTGPWMMDLTTLILVCYSYP